MSTSMSLPTDLSHKIALVVLCFVALLKIETREIKCNFNIFSILSSWYKCSVVGITTQRKLV